MNPHFYRGQILLQQKRYPGAVEEFRQALALDPEAAMLHGMLAVALMHANQWQEALRSAKMAVQKEPDSSSAHWTLGLIWLNREYHKEAEESIRKSIELDPEDADGHGLLARTLCESNRNEAAVEAAEAGLALDPVNDLCLTFRARALIALGRNAEAHHVTETLLREDPLDAWNHCLRGDQLLMQGKHAEAREHYLESLRLMPGNESARHGLVLTLKARSPIYAFFLNLLARMSRIKPVLGWSVLIAVLVALHFGNRFFAQHPDWMVPYEIAKASVFAFLVLVYIANPIFDLLLRFDREGRLALSDDEIRATNWYLACFGFAALCGVWAMLAQKAFLPKSFGYAALFFCGPVREVFQATPGYVRKRMGLITSLFGAGLVLTPVIGICGLIFSLMTRSFSAVMPLVHFMIWMPVAVILYSCFADNLREWLERRRPDE